MEERILEILKSGLKQFGVFSFFLLLFALVISSGILYSIYAILVDLVSKQVYSKPKDFLTLILTAVLEPLFFHPIVAKCRGPVGDRNGRKGQGRARKVPFHVGQCQGQ